MIGPLPLSEVTTLSLNGWRGARNKEGESRVRPLEFLGKLKKLEQLSLQDCPNLINADLGYVGLLPDLKFLHLNCSRKISDTGLDRLHSLKNLTYLDISDCAEIKGPGLLRLIAALPGLKTIGVENCNLNCIAALTGPEGTFKLENAVLTRVEAL